MKFLLDEDVPLKLLKILQKAGHDVVRVTPASGDPAIADLARQEGRILITLDKDFTNRSLYPPERFTIIHLRIHPPYAQDLINVLTSFLERVPTERLKGLIVLGAAGSIRAFE